MRARLTHRFRFEAARRLPRLPVTHPCAHVHGHGFQVEVDVVGEIDPALGWVVDYAEIAEAWAPLAAKLDHAYLNDVEGLDNPTSERIAVWVWEKLAPTLPGLVRVRILETPDTIVSFEGPTPTTEDTP